MTDDYRQRLGRWGERQAADFLSARGYTLLEQNARTQYGEIDLVASQMVSQESLDCLEGEERRVVTVFIEVKTRSSTEFGFPEAAITGRKREHMLASAQAYLQAHPELGDDWRVDVIAIQRFPSDQEPEIIHFENALT